MPTAAMPVIEFFVPGQPQGKGRARIGRVNGHARAYTPAKTVAYEGLIATLAQQAMGNMPLIDGPCACTLDIGCQVPTSWSQKRQRRALLGHERPTTKPDIDNVEKAVFDGCNGIVWRDDVQVVDVRKVKRYSDKPGVMVLITHANVGLAATQQAALDV